MTKYPLLLDGVALAVEVVGNLLRLGQNQLVLLVVDGVAVCADLHQLAAQLLQIGDGLVCQLLHIAVRPDVLELVAGQRRQNRLADARAVQRTAQADTARHPHRAALGLINVYDVPPVADDEMHGLAGALGQLL